MDSLHYERINRLVELGKRINGLVTVGRVNLHLFNNGLTGWSSPALVCRSILLMET